MHVDPTTQRTGTETKNLREEECDRESDDGKTHRKPRYQMPTMVLEYLPTELGHVWRQNTYSSTSGRIWV